MDDVGIVPTVDRSSSSASGVNVPTPILPMPVPFRDNTPPSLPPLLIRAIALLSSHNRNELVTPELTIPIPPSFTFEDCCNCSLPKVGVIVPIPIFPLFARNNLEASPASPPGDVLKLSEPPVRTLNVSDGFAPVGTCNDRFDEMVAVGVPPAILINPNVADEVAVPPRSK